MGYVLIIITAILGIIGVLSDPIKKKEKVHKLGWVVIGLLIVVFIISIVNEKKSTNEKENSKLRNDSLRVNLKNTFDELQETKNLLTKQVEINLLTVLSENKPIKDGSWWLSFSNQANLSENIGEFIFSPRFNKYKKTAIGEIYFHPFMGITSRVEIRHSGDSIYYTDTQKEYDKEFHIDPELHFPRILDEYFEFVWKDDFDLKKDTSHFIISKKVLSNENLKSAAIAYRDLKKNNQIGAITFKLEKQFDTKEDYRMFRDSTKLEVSKLWHNISNDVYNAEFVMDSLVQNDFIKYWKSNFKSSSVSLYLENESYLMMTSKIGIDTIKRLKNGVKIEFKTMEDPKLRIGIVDLK